VRAFTRNQEVPSPLCFEPPDGAKLEYAPGERMRFGFIVVDQAAEYMPYFIHAFSKLNGGHYLGSPMTVLTPNPLETAGTIARCVRTTLHLPDSLSAWSY
jgi:hypothetical protein